LSRGAGADKVALDARKSPRTAIISRPVLVGMIRRKFAKAPGLTIPLSILGRADEVIE
jgi:hypothetical protein